MVEILCTRQKRLTIRLASSHFKRSHSIKVERKTLGTLGVAKDSVTAGSLVDLRIEYKFSEELTAVEREWYS